jgi:hypothetical protein
MGHGLRCGCLGREGACPHACSSWHPHAGLMSAICVKCCQDLHSKVAERRCTALSNLVSNFYYLWQHDIKLDATVTLQLWTFRVCTIN